MILRIEEVFQNPNYTKETSTPEIRMGNGE